MSKKSKITELIEKLLLKADSTDSPEEGQLFREKAQSLGEVYSIDIEKLNDEKSFKKEYQFLTKHESLFFINIVYYVTRRFYDSDLYKKFKGGWKLESMATQKEHAEIEALASFYMPHYALERKKMRGSKEKRLSDFLAKQRKDLEAFKKELARQDTYFFVHYAHANNLAVSIDEFEDIEKDDTTDDVDDTDSSPDSKTRGKKSYDGEDGLRAAYSDTPDIGTITYHKQLTI